MNVISSIRQLIFNENNSNDNNIINKKEKKRITGDYPIGYYKYLFKSNYKMKKSNKTNNNNNLTLINFNYYKQKEEFPSELKIKVNKCSKYDKSKIEENKNKKIFKQIALSPINKNKLNDNNNINTNFFYILKGAIFIIEDWWKKIMIKKNNNKNIIKRNINSKNYELFSKKYNNKSKKNNSVIFNSFNTSNNNINNIKIQSINKKPNKINNIISLNRNTETKKNKISKYNNNIIPKIKSINLNGMITSKDKTNDSIEKNKNQSQKESLLEDTVIDYDSGYYEFTDNNNIKNDDELINKEKNKINKIMKLDEEIRKRKIYSSDKINNNKKININENEKGNEENIETKRENSIIYPMNEIEHLVLEDICSDLDNHLKQNMEKEKKIIENYNNKKNQNLPKNKNNKNNINKDLLEKKNNKEVEKNRISIQWEDPNNNMTPFISIEHNNELFNEIKSKIKVNLKKINDEYESEISIIQNKQLLRENPLNDSSIYIQNSDIKQNELIRNVNIHIIPNKTKENSITKNYKNKFLNNSNNSNTIQLEDEEYGFSELINISDCKNDGHTSSFFNSIYKNDYSEKDKRKNIENGKKLKEDNVNKINLKKFENIYKN